MRFFRPKLWVVLLLFVLWLFSGFVLIQVIFGSAGVVNPYRDFRIISVVSLLGISIYLIISLVYRLVRKK